MPRVGRAAAQLPGAFPPGRLAAPAEALGCGGVDTEVARSLRGRGLKCLAAPDPVENLVRRPTQPSDPPRAQAGRVTVVVFDGEKG